MTTKDLRPETPPEVEDGSMDEEIWKQWEEANDVEAAERAKQKGTTYRIGKWDYPEPGFLLGSALDQLRHRNESWFAREVLFVRELSPTGEERIIDLNAWFHAWGIVFIRHEKDATLPAPDNDWDVVEKGGEWIVVGIRTRAGMSYVPCAPPPGPITMDEEGYVVAPAS